MTSSDQHDDSITYVDFDPLGALGKPFALAAYGHVHIRISDRCIKREAGELCGTDNGPVEIRGEDGPEILVDAARAQGRIRPYRPSGREMWIDVHADHPKASA